MGLPGSLPRLNKRVIELALRIALALNCEIPPVTNFFRKNYFYPDNPKNFQITQYDKAGGSPIARNGFLDSWQGRVRIRRIQIEEDPGKLSYDGNIVSSPYALVDYNRAGIALTEIVTEPDLKNPRHAREFLYKLRSILEHIGVSDGSLEGSIRADANVSLSGGKRVEIKNVSSFKEVDRALNFEITRQKTLPGGVMETRHWDEVRRVTVTLRIKEGEEDYRYFPEPDLSPVTISAQLIEDVKRQMPELPDQRRARFVKEFQVSDEIAKILTSEKAIADFFEEVLSLQPSPKIIGAWLAVDIPGYLKRQGLDFKEMSVNSSHVAELAKELAGGKISNKVAKSILMKLLSDGGNPRKYLETEAEQEPESLQEIIGKVFDVNSDAVGEAQQNPKVIDFLIGQVMKETRGRGDHALMRKIISERLNQTS
jgi:aspartyl-tRNA(Asn)/glutamyl-tRNA(Gln) amidotransferase subunit B